MGILKTINQEVTDYRTKQTQVIPSLYYNQYQVIQDIIFYYNSKFKTGPVDDDGDRKYFYNIVKNPCKVCTKGIDFDTKDIRLLTAGGGDPTKTWFMERDLRYWMRDQQFGTVLNRIFYEIPIYGSVVLKVVDGKCYFVDLRNFVMEQTAETLKDSNYVIEIHNYTVGEFRKVGKAMGWDQSIIDQVVKKFHLMKDTSHIRVYERYGDVPTEGATGDITWDYKRTFHADVGVDEYDQWGALIAAYPGVELGSDSWDPDNLPYWEFHLEKISGRWLGVGIVETLFEPQVRENELTNLQSKSSYWAALRLFQTRSPDGGNRNLMTDARNGEVLSIDSEITQIDMADRNLAFFNEQHQKWIQNRDEMTIAYAPVGHSVIAVEVAQQQVVSYFEQIKEGIALTVKELLFEVVIPEFEKDARPEHTIRLVGQDLDTYIAMCKNELVAQEVIRQVTLGNFPTSQERDTIGMAVEAAIKQKKEKILTVPKGFYSDVKYDVDIDITGESVDVKARAATKFAILQAITSDPTMLQDPIKRKLISSYMEDGGVNPEDIFGAEKIGQETAGAILPPNTVTGRAGGGVSAPQLGASTPQLGKSVVTI